MFGQVGNLEQLFSRDHSQERADTDYRLPPPEFGKGRWSIVHRDNAERTFLLKGQYAESGVAEARGVSQNRIEYESEIAVRSAYQVQHFRCHRLLLLRLVQQQCGCHCIYHSWRWPTQTLANSMTPVERHAVIPEVIARTASTALPVRAKTQPWF